MFAWVANWLIGDDVIQHGYRLLSPSSFSDINVDVVPFSSVGYVAGLLLGCPIGGLFGDARGMGLGMGAGGLEGYAGGVLMRDSLSAGVGLEGY